MTQIPTWSGGPVSPTSGRAAPGATIGGRYSLRAAVGHGGMGTVWRAADTLLRRDVAVKEVVLPPGLAPSDRDAMYERTLREARAAAALQHPAVVQVYDVVTEGGRPWIVMELLDARSLADMVIEDGPLAPRAVAKIGIALLGALEVAHAIGVLHRDVKPANVLIASDGRCVLTDFGVARMPTDVQLTTPGMVLGSPHFISPERAMGSDFGPPSDLFSLGVTLYTAVEGRPPFDRGDPIETMHAVVEDPPAPPSRSGPLTDVLMGLLEKDPSRRFDVDTSRNMLRELLAGPLASTAAGHFVTDPYSVVPAQRAPWQPPTPPATPQPSGQIGGSAMLAPGESLTDRLAQLRKSGGQGAHAGGGDQTKAGGALSTPTGAMPAGGRWEETGPAIYGTPGGSTGTYGGSRSGGNGALGNAVAGARRFGDTALTTVKGWPRKMQLAAAGGVVLVLVIGIIALSGGDSDPAAPVPQAGATPTAPAGPTFPVQTHAERGVSVNVPEGWKKNAPKNAVYIDFTDPADAGRRVRVLIEKASSNPTPTKFLEAAGGQLAKPDSKSCTKPYAQVALQDVEIGGKPAGELEYTCGEGDTKRHGIWRAIIQDGKAYEFYLTTPDARFQESKPIFDEMVRSFTITGIG
ncbi:protein kinase domain-containing protein [Micromonospora sp. NPDC004704]